MEHMEHMEHMEVVETVPSEALSLSVPSVPPFLSFPL